MTNVCSEEHPFWRKAGNRHSGITTVCLIALVLLTSGCLADPQRVQTVDLLDRLTSAHGMLGDFPAPPEACNAVGDIETRLYGEPGLTEVRPAWSELTAAANALQAVCGQNALLLQDVTGSAALESARDRWREGSQREMGVACDHLRAAASALGRPAPC